MCITIINITLISTTCTCNTTCISTTPTYATTLITTVRLVQTPTARHISNISRKREKWQCINHLCIPPNHHNLDISVLPVGRYIIVAFYKSTHTPIDNANTCHHQYYISSATTHTDRHPPLPIPIPTPNSSNW